MSTVCTEDISSAGPIQSETSPKVLRNFLEIIYIGRKVEWGIGDRDDPVDAIQRVYLAKRWDCELVEKLARASLVSDIEARPWEIFKAASTLKDVVVAKQCLAAFKNKNVPDLLLIWSTQLCLGTFEGVSRDYFFELYRLVQDTPRIPWYAGEREPSMVNWKSVASQFFA